MKVLINVAVHRSLREHLTRHLEAGFIVEHVKLERLSKSGSRSGEAAA